MKTALSAIQGIGFTLLLIATSCVKNDVYQAPIIHEISDEFKAYTVFDSASFWVYRNDQNTSLDTVTIVKVLTDKRFHVDYTGAPGFYYNAIELLYQSSRIGFTKAELTAGSKFDANTIMSENYRLYFENGRFLSIFTPKFPLGSTQLLGINEGNYTNLIVHDTLFLNENQYFGVYETSVKDYHDGNDTVFMKFYIAQHYGLIKMTKHSTTIDESWSLVGSSLTQSK
jgi:hypothetical protein